MDLKLPAISVIIVIWNSARELPDCLESLSKQTFKDFEVIVVDNGSSDGACANLPDDWPTLRFQIIPLDRNNGFAVANNIGVRAAQGHWVALLNADAFPEQNWLYGLEAAARENPRYNFFTSRQIQAGRPELMDGAGDEYHVSGLAWRRYYGQESITYGLQAEEVFGACAAAALYVREDFLKVGGFDEDYFSYFEDVDLSFRLRIAGGRCLYVPAAIVYHVGSASSGKMSDFVIYHGHRNLVWTYFKNMPGILFWLYLPLHIIMNIYFMFSFISKGKSHAIFSAKRDAFLSMGRILGKRKIVQSSCKTSTPELFRAMRTGVFDPYRASKHRKKEHEKGDQ
jgi:GT2 family glycosyltransferase